MSVIDRGKVLELLERLGRGEELAQAALAMGLSQAQAREAFALAAQLLRQALSNHPQGGNVPSLNWSEMTVAEALTILGDHGAQAHPGALAPTSGEET